MSTGLNPSVVTVTAMRSAILANLKLDVPSMAIAELIAPLLNQINAWHSQIPLMLEGSGASNSINLIFAIRKDLFTGPYHSQSVLGISLTDLPGAFLDFKTFIMKMIEAQKVERDKTETKAITTPSSDFLFTHYTPYIANSPGPDCQVQAHNRR